MCEMVCYMFREFRWNACCTNDAGTPATVWWNSFCMNQEVRWNSGGKSPARGSARGHSFMLSSLQGTPAAGTPPELRLQEVLSDILLPELRWKSCWTSCYRSSGATPATGTPAAGCPVGTRASRNSGTTPVGTPGTPARFLLIYAKFLTQFSSGGLI